MNTVAVMQLLLPAFTVQFIWKDFEMTESRNKIVIAPRNKVINFIEFFTFSASVLYLVFETP